MNYAVISPNKLHEELCEILVDNDLTMAKLEYKDSIHYQIEMYFKKCNYIQYSTGFDNPDEMFNDICRVLKENNKDDINTIMLYSTDEYVYEMVYFENYNNKEYDEDLFNQFASITNIELLPIYDKCAVIKTNIKTNVKSTCIDYKDITNIVMKTFYHTGIMVDTDNKITEIVYISEHPYASIGTTFTKTKDIIINNLCFLLYEEKENNNVMNKKASKLFNTEIKGRVFISLISPIFYKKIWDMNSTILNLVLNSINNESVEKELDDNRTINPFVVINKYINK
jgi:hypothetical protein